MGTILDYRPTEGNLDVQGSVAAAAGAGRNTTLVNEGAIDVQEQDEVATGSSISRQQRINLR